MQSTVHLFQIVLLFFTLAPPAEGMLAADFCHKATLKSSPNCDNIYIWESDRKEFMSLLSAPFPQPQRTDFNALEGKIVKVIADNMKPYILSDNNSNALSGYLGDIWTIAEEALRFKSDVISINYDMGLVMISRGDAHIMLAAGVVKDGLVGVRYSQPYLNNWYQLFTKRPEARPSATSYVKTLSTELWYASFLMFFLLTSALWITIKLLKYAGSNEPTVSIPTCFLSVCSGFLNQGPDLQLRSYSCRIEMFFAFVTAYMLYSAMNAVLVAKLATFSVELPFNSLQELSTIKHFSVCLRTNSFVYNEFTDHYGENRTVKSRWQNILNGPGCLDINVQDNLAQILCSDKIIVLENRVVMATVHSSYSLGCSLAVLNKRYFLKQNTFLISKKFGNRRVLERFISLVRSSGVMRRLEEKWLKTDILKQMEEQQTQTVQAPQVSFDHISGIITLYGSIMLVSVLVLAIEILEQRYSAKIKIPYVN